MRSFRDALCRRVCWFRVARCDRRGFVLEPPQVPVTKRHGCVLEPPQVPVTKWRGFQVPVTKWRGFVLEPPKSLYYYCLLPITYLHDYFYNYYYYTILYYTILD